MLKSQSTIIFRVLFYLVSFINVTAWLALIGATLRGVGPDEVYVIAGIGITICILGIILGYLKH